MSIERWASRIYIMNFTKIRIIILLLIASGTYFASRLLNSLMWSDFWELCTQSTLNPHDSQSIGPSMGIVSAIIVGPIIEEYLFRFGGFKIFQKYAPNLPLHYSIILTSFAFCVAHYQYWQYSFDWQNLMRLFLVGLVYANVFSTRRKIIDSIVVHSTVNLLIILPKDAIFGKHCFQFNGWIGQAESLTIFLLTILVTIILISTLRLKIPGLAPATLISAKSNTNKF